MRKIHTNKNWRPQMGEPFEKLAQRVLKKTNTGNLSADWTETDAIRYLAAKGWEAISQEPIPDDVKLLLPRYYADLDAG